MDYTWKEARDLGLFEETAVSLEEALAGTVETPEPEDSDGGD